MQIERQCKMKEIAVLVHGYQSVPSLYHHFSLYISLSITAPPFPRSQACLRNPAPSKVCYVTLSP